MLTDSLKSAQSLYSTVGQDCHSVVLHTKSLIATLVDHLRMLKPEIEKLTPDHETSWLLRLLSRCDQECRVREKLQFLFDTTCQEIAETVHATQNAIKGIELIDSRQSQLSNLIHYGQADITQQFQAGSLYQRWFGLNDLSNVARVLDVLNVDTRYLLRDLKASHATLTAFHSDLIHLSSMVKTRGKLSEKFGVGGMERAILFVLRELLLTQGSLDDAIYGQSSLP